MTTSAKPTAKSRRKRWLKISLISFAILLLLILLLPTLLSTAPGKALILSQVNKHLPGKLSASSLSLGWFSSAKLQKVEYADPAKKSLLSLENVNTGVTVWDFLTGSTIDLRKFSIAGGRTPDFPDVIVAAHLSGTADLAKKLIHFTSDSEITAADQKTGKANAIKFPAGSVVSFGDLANDFHATVTYELPLLQPFFADKLPAGSVLEGSYTVNFHVTGPFTRTGLKVDETQIGEGRIYMEGFDIGAAQIPVSFEKGILTIIPTDLPFKSGGRIRVRGKLDLNQNPPAFIIDTPDDPDHPFIQDLDLNQKIAAGKLRFFPLFWGAVDQQGNVGQVSGKVTVRLDSVFIPFNAAAFKAKGSLSGSLSITNLNTDAPFFSQVTNSLGDFAKLTRLSFLNVRNGDIPDVAFSLANGKVSYQNLRLGSALANLTFSGSVGLDNSLALDMQVGLPGINLPIPIALNGTTSKPQLTLNGKLPDISDVGKSLQQASDLFNKLIKGKKK